MASRGSGGRFIAAGEYPAPLAPVPPCPLRTTLAGNDLPENGKTSPLKFLAFRKSVV